MTSATISSTGRIMQHSKEVNNFAQDLVSHYATWDKLSECYALSLNNIPDFTVHSFSALIMSSDTMLAAEATSIDNPEYTSKMLPALNKYLSDVTNKDSEIAFNNIWKDSVTNYCYDIMQELIDAKCAERMYGEKEDQGLYQTSFPAEVGDIYWSRYV